ncbi:YifB family Mg chelatase-like AAA ATPase [Nocardioides acrostichi]|uniref:YifB family Mg chelatase-like AAA ATPase n=1 Tax=Nocardioides acrostichi TaxID=2784339 RepID=A0A930Y9K5_9ACTN|nr:YifB family Mg chelatase-like AAA ATPase [Nocardioides acrostichi]MBF4160463.1 YifB family Mg chelatase-like AAA ATPase [Nocardioides acrostichi]
MPVATAHSVALRGAVGHVVPIQADVSPGQVGTTWTGRVDTSVNEAQHRCRMAIINSGLPWPATKRITVLFAPADLRKHGTHYDLGAAIAIVAAAGSPLPENLAGCLFIGELALDGALRPVASVLPMVLAAREQGFHTVFVPEPQAAEAAMVPGVSVFGMRSLAQVHAVLAGDEVPDAAPVAAAGPSSLLSWRGSARHEEVDLGDLLGMADARYALEVAAAGGHHLLLEGPKGSGKTSLAERVPTILPDLTAEESLELTAIHSLAGVLDASRGLITRPPYSAPHHDASKASIVGGGSGQVRPGELSRAHAGVLFLDEFPLFRRDVIEALREPLESGEITVSRTDEQVTLPARGMVVLAANPCPCGDFVENALANRCRCRETVRRDYRARVTGPVADRLDITRHVAALTPHERLDRFAVIETSAVVRARVAAARARQAARYETRAWRLNAQVPSVALRDEWPLSEQGRDVVEEAVRLGRLTSRGAVRVHRLAWTVLDLRRRDDPPGEERPGAPEVSVALRLRSGEPLEAATVAAVAG